MIDHVFMLVDADGPEFGYLATLGLVETYRRDHKGQGTQNICYCFDNLFLELLWVNDSDAARSDLIRRTGLYERSLWRTNGTCPFGISLRRSESAPAVPTWEFTPPYLPKGMFIPVAIDSDDLRQPMMFESPGSGAPIDWPTEKRGALQHGAGLGAVIGINLTMPSSPSDALAAIARSETPPVSVDGPGAYRLDLLVASSVERRGVGEPALKITLPLLS